MKEKGKSPSQFFPSFHPFLSILILLAFISIFHSFSIPRTLLSPSPPPLLPRSIFSINYFFFPPIPFRPHSPFIHFYLPFNFHPSHNLSSPLPFLAPSFHWFIAVSCDPRLRLLFTYQSFAFRLSFSLISLLPSVSPFHLSFAFRLSFLLISLLPSVSPFHLSVFCLQSPFYLSFAFRLSFSLISLAFSLSFSLISLLPSVSFSLIFCLPSLLLTYQSFAFNLLFTYQSFAFR